MPANRNVISADSHIREPYDLWWNTIGNEFGDRTPRIIHEYKGLTGDFFFSGGPIAKVIRTDVSGKEEGTADLFLRAGYEPAARIEFQDMVGIKAEVIFPSVFASIMQAGVGDVVHAAATVYNDWLDEYCAPARDRLLGMAAVPTYDVNLAVAELERCRKKGYRGALINVVSPEAQPVRLVLTSSSAPETAESLILDLPGRTGEWVVVSAHLDGHAVAESAIDNASGVVVALAVAEALEPVMSENQRGLRVCMFNIEEWGLLASRSYVNGLSEAERESIAVNINLDSVAGNDRLTCMISGFTRLRSLTTEACEAARVDADHYVPLVRNSDHYYFAEAGIPAMRVVAGFGDVETNLRYVLTEGDTRGLITTSQLEHAARFAVALTLRAAQAPSRMVAGWRTID